jgi:AcrR family transcriptional regulator
MEVVMARPIKTPFSPDQRQVIGHAAEALFAERGFDGTPIRAIAQQAGSTKALIYHYYHNKEDLYLSLLEAAVSAVVTQIEDIAASGDGPEEKVRGVVRVFLDYYHTHPQRFHMIQRAIDEHSAAAAILAERWFARVHLALGTIAEQGVRQGIFRPLPPHMTPFVVIGLIIHALRSHKMVARVTLGLSATQLLSSLPDLIVALLKAEEGKEEASQRGKKALSQKE